MKNTRISIFLALFASLLSLTLAAQDYHFSDPTRTITLFNPAFTGLIPEGSKYRFQTAARSQWSSVLDSDHYRTFATAFEFKICGDNAGDYFALGANAAVDFQGDPALQRTDLFLTAAFVRRIGGSQNKPVLLGGGAEVGRVQYSQGGLAGRTFDDQFDNPSLPGELLDQYAVDAYDLGVGVFLTAPGNERGLHDLSAGLAIKHLTQPSLGFYGNDGSGQTSSDSTARLNRRLNLNLGFSVFKKRKGNLSLFAAYSNQRPHNQFLFRAMYNLLGQRETVNLGAGKSSVKSRLLSGGLALRVNDGAGGFGGDALIGILQLHQKGYILSASYDMNISGLAQSTGTNGAIELGASFFFGKANCINCPQF